MTDDARMKVDERMTDAGDDRGRARRIGAVTVGVVAIAMVAIFVLRRHPDLFGGDAGAKAKVVSVVEYQGEIETVPPVDEARRLAIARAIADVLRDVKLCMDGIYGTVLVELAFDANGAASARYSARNPLPVEALFRDDCVLEQAKRAHVAPGPPVVVTYPFRNIAPAGVVEKAARDILDGSATIAVPGR